MKVLVFGAAGSIGRAIVAELLNRGHTVTAATRSGAAIEGMVVQVVTGDAADPDAVARLAAGQNAVVSAIGPGRGEDPAASLLGAARGLIDGMRRVAEARLVIVGGAGSLEVASGQRLVDTPDFPAEWKPGALAHAKALDVFRGVQDLDWTYISPAALVESGDRTGSFRVGSDRLVTDETGASRISIPDLAIAAADEVEHAEAIRRRITVAY